MSDKTIRLVGIHQMLRQLLSIAAPASLAARFLVLIRVALVSTVLAMCNPSDSHSGVVYNWQSVGTELPIEATIVLRDEAWRAGGASMELRQHAAVPVAYDDLPIEDLRFSIPSDVDWSPADVDWGLSGYVAPCHATAGHSYSLDDCLAYLGSLDQLAVQPFHDLRLNLQVQGAGLIFGDIYWNSGIGGFAIGISGGPLWHVYTFGSDRTSFYCINSCPYSPGLFVVDANTIPIPEPGSLWYLGAALAALVARPLAHRLLARLGEDGGRANRNMLCREHRRE